MAKPNKRTNDQYARTASQIMKQYELKGRKQIIVPWLLRELKDQIAAALRIEAAKRPMEIKRAAVKKNAADQIDIEDILGAPA